LRAYTRTDKYLANMRAGAARFDLNGNPAGEVSKAMQRPRRPGCASVVRRK
jgi:sRNA-binding protein